MINRTTKKYGDGQYLYTGSPGEARRKLGQLEDVEEELGIDLVTLFKALRQDFVYVRTNSGVEKNKGFNICGFTLWSQVKLNPKDYGKTWATSKEELE